MGGSRAGVVRAARIVGHRRLRVPPRQGQAGAAAAPRGGPAAARGGRAAPYHRAIGELLAGAARPRLRRGRGLASGRGAAIHARELGPAAAAGAVPGLHRRRRRPWSPRQRALDARGRLLVLGGAGRLLGLRPAKPDEEAQPAATAVRRRTPPAGAGLAARSQRGLARERHVAGRPEPRQRSAPAADAQRLPPVLDVLADGWQFLADAWPPHHRADSTASCRHRSVFDPLGRLVQQPQFNRAAGARGMGGIVGCEQRGHGRLRRRQAAASPPDIAAAHRRLQSRNLQAWLVHRHVAALLGEAGLRALRRGHERLLLLAGGSVQRRAHDAEARRAGGRPGLCRSTDAALHGGVGQREVSGRPPMPADVHGGGGGARARAEQDAGRARHRQDRLLIGA
mmetsp:Transcript_34642/g.99860  ORF Transcript_34642/g.99860 Transcript_34642/m.99860 type:complete len:396 (+) Transcript_34642:906-2093(+)